MNILSLFDGISCGRVALEKAGVIIDNYYASEIDNYAIQVSKNNYPDIKRLGDINNFLDGNWYKDTYNSGQRDYNRIIQPDLIIGGSPCQGFSFAGKQLAFDDPRSALYWKYVEILSYYKPKYFLLENVLMKKEYLQVITNALGVEPICINSALVSAHNRKRYYWTNIPNVTQPNDIGIVLKDILEDGLKYSCRMVGRKLNAETGKRENYNNEIKIEQHIEPRLDGKSNCLTTVSKDCLVYKLKDNKRVKVITENERGYRPHRGDIKATGISELGRILKPESKTDTITSNHAPKLALNSDINNLIYRQLTPIECERLQTLPDNYTQGVSNTQRYKMLGNGWTVDVLAHILQNIKTGI